MQSYIISLYDYVIKTVPLFGLVVLGTSKIQFQKGSAYFEMSIKIRQFNTSGLFKMNLAQDSALAATCKLAKSEDTSFPVLIHKSSN